MSTHHSATDAVLLTRDGEVAIVELNRPERLNAINDDLVEALHDALSEVEVSGCGAMVLAGRGRAFCAGHDLKEPRGDDATLRHRLNRLQDLTRRLRELPVPVIAAVHGHAAGAGAELTFDCDLILAAEGTRFRFPEVSIGLTVTNGLTKLLPLYVGPVKAKELFLLAEPLEAADALQLGLVNRVVPADDLIDAALAWGRRIASSSRLATSLTKAALNMGIDSSFEGSLQLEHSHAFIVEMELRNKDRTELLATSRSRNTTA
jgi:2-(1,2-epoxy-1,2-dihydrophenyl)acetyl-CoA isomerase